MFKNQLKIQYTVHVIIIHSTYLFQNHQHYKAIRNNVGDLQQIITFFKSSAKRNFILIGKSI